jgi:predicted permease
MGVSLPEKAYATDEKRALYLERALDGLRGVGGVASAAAVSSLPLTGEYSTSGFQIDGAEHRDGQALFQSVSPDYLGAMGIPVLTGRALSRSDRGGTVLVAVVNRAFSRKYLAGRTAEGEALIVPSFSLEHGPEGARLVNVPHRVAIVGVVGDVNQLGLDASARPEILFPYEQRTSDSMTLVVRAGEGVPPASLVAGARRALQAVDPDLPVTDVRTMDGWIRRSTAPSRFVLVLIGVFAFAAVTLAGVGIYGVVSYSVSRQRHDMAVRLALGATPASMIRRVTARHFGWVAAGVVVGAASAVAVTRLLQQYLYGVEPADVPTYSAAAALLLLVALAANLVPASRVAAIDPAAALRSE